MNKLWNKDIKLEGEREPQKLEDAREMASRKPWVICKVTWGPIREFWMTKYDIKGKSWLAIN